MEQLMELLTNLFGEGADLAAIASTAGVGGGALSIGVATLLFRGVIMRFLAQIVTTGLLTGAGFLALLNYLGFELVAKEDTAAASITDVLDRSGLPNGGVQSGLMGTESLSDGQGAENEQADDEKGKTIIYKSPWRDGD